MSSPRHEPSPLRIPPKPFDLSAAEASIWDLDGPDGADRLWRRPLLRRLPEELAATIAERYRRTWKRAGRGSANAELRESTEGITRSSLRLSASDQDIRDKAKAWALAGMRLSMRCKDPAARHSALYEFTLGHGLTPPPVKRYGIKGSMARMCDPKWWRRVT